MKTREDFEAMTKAELDAYGNEVFGVDLDGRLAKAKMIDELMRLQEEHAATEPPADDPAEEPEADEPEEATAASGAEMVTITCTYFPDTAGVPVNINGRRLHLPLNKPVPVPAWMLPSLENIRGLRFTKE